MLIAMIIMINYELFTYFALNHFLLKKHEQTSRAFSFEERCELVKNSFLSHKAIACLVIKLFTKSFKNLAHAPTMAISKTCHFDNII